MNLTACAIKLIITTRRGGLTCPPETRCVCTNKVVRHPIYGNQNPSGASGFVRAERYFREGMWDC